MTDATPPGPTSTSARRPDRGTLALGALLVIGGLLLFAGQQLGIGLDDLGWPMIVVTLGVVLFVLGMTVSAEEGMVVGGVVVSTVGLVLLFQDRTGLWSTWAYAWALVGPAASGLGLLVWGARTANPRKLREGAWAFLGGLAMFLVGFLFFEGIVGLNDLGLNFPEWVLPVVVIGLGVVVLGRGLLSREPSAGN